MLKSRGLYAHCIFLPAYILRLTVPSILKRRDLKEQSSPPTETYVTSGLKFPKKKLATEYKPTD